MNISVRALTFACVLTVAAISAQSNGTAALAKTNKLSGVPVPTCPPSDPNGCGIGQMSGN